MATEETEDRRDKDPRDEGSPITVGGGGGMDGKGKREDGLPIQCTFKETDYPEPAGNAGKKKFRHANWKIQTFKIGTTAGVVDHSDLLPESGNCVIVIHCEGDNDDVTINGKPFGIDMDTRTYIRDRGGVVHTNPNAASYISRVDFITPGEDPQSWFFNADDGCAVCTDHIPNSPYCA